MKFEAMVERLESGDVIEIDRPTASVKLGDDLRVLVEYGDVVDDLDQGAMVSAVLMGVANSLIDKARAKDDEE